MWARGRITDRQKAAADRFLSTYELAHSDGVKGIDYSKLKVDCMSGGDAFMGERQFRAVKELDRIERWVVGRAGYSTMVKVVVEGRTIRQVAMERCATSKVTLRDMQSFVSLRIVEALDELDAHWNTAVGAGSGVRAEIGERTTVRVELTPVDVYSHMSKEELQEHGRKVMAALTRMRDEAAKRGECYA